VLSRQSEMEEKRALAGSNTATTYFAKAQSELTLQDQAGRYSADVLVTGSWPSQQWPTMPSDSPWHHDPTGDEPPLGWSVEAQEPCSEQFELEASIQAELAKAALVSSSVRAAASEVAEAPLPADAGDVGDDQRPQPFRLRRI
jgi:hypothetical protein